MLEPMAAFFDSRLQDYDEHMLQNIAGAGEFYPFTAAQLPVGPDAHILDLGCGTGLELEWYFLENPTAKVTGIDLAPGMLQKLREKFPDKRIDLLCGSYFDLPFPPGYGAAVSVESLHHFTAEEKLPLYIKIYRALKPEGYFILTDYFSLSEEEEHLHRQQYLQLKNQQGIGDAGFYHYDTPLTVTHEMQVLYKAGFTSVQILKNWGATYTLKASKGEYL